MAVSFLLALLFFPSLNRKKVWRHLYHRLNDKRRIRSYDICLTETMSLLCLLMAAAENSKTNFLRTKGDSRNFTMTAILHLGILFLAKILDNALGNSDPARAEHPGRSDPGCFQLYRISDHKADSHGRQQYGHDCSFRRQRLRLLPGNGHQQEACQRPALCQHSHVGQQGGHAGFARLSRSASHYECCGRQLYPQLGHQNDYRDRLCTDQSRERAHQQLY